MKIDTPTITGEVIDATNIKDELDARVTMSANEIDWNLGNSFKHPTITGAVTLTDTNLPQGTKTKTISLEIDGDFAITFPAYWIWKGGTYDGTVMNRIIIDCVNGTSASEEVYYTIIPNA